MIADIVAVDEMDAVGLSVVAVTIFTSYGLFSQKVISQGLPHKNLVGIKLWPFNCINLLQLSLIQVREIVCQKDCVNIPSFEK